MTRPGRIAAKAVNQYRRRDVFAYLGLRYYLENTSARSDQWAQQVATTLASRRKSPGYLRVDHFKEVHAEKGVLHRSIFLPAPNEALAEAALLDACAQVGKAFSPAKSLFSYRLSGKEDLSGSFEHYMLGLKDRHAAIAAACRGRPGSIVAHLDVQRFYPSITCERARKAWFSACDASELGKAWTELGDHLLALHGEAPDGKPGNILTGPMLSHLIGNLVLRHIDEEMTGSKVAYFRYVDDITLVGDPRDVKSAVSMLEDRLDDLGLRMHGRNSDKYLEVSSKDWLKGEHDFADGNVSDMPSWKTLIGDLKRFLVLRPEGREDLIAALKSEDIRLPVPDYAVAVSERGYRERFKMLFKAGWRKLRQPPPSIHDLVGQAARIREKSFSEASDLVEQMHSADAFLEKRLLPKIRYRFGRLAYLGQRHQLTDLADQSSRFHSLTFQRVVATAIGSNDLSEILAYGANAAQAVAQPLLMQNQRVAIPVAPTDQVGMQAVAVLQMNGVIAADAGIGGQASELLRFSERGSNRQVMRSGAPWLREVSCLHGVSDTPRHRATLSTAFDEAEDIVLDAIEQGHQSS